MFAVYNYVTFSLAETMKRQKQKMNEMTKELEGVKKNYQTVSHKMDRVTVELERTQTECVLLGLKSIDIDVIRCARDRPLVYTVI